jgi:ubiquinone/menaquinone biosynthesis C-methylase UbiE
MNDDESRVAAGYDAVYAALPASTTFARIWRQHATGPDYPEGYEHISFLTLVEMRVMTDALQAGPASTLVDLACGMGGPGLWIARESGASLRGIDVSSVAVKNARDRAAALNLTHIADFSEGTFETTGLPDNAADAVMTVDALQYAPAKQAAMREAARILRPGGRLVFACFEVDPPRVAGLPILSTDPIDDYRPLLKRAGFDVSSYEETAGWLERLTAAYQAIVDSKDVLTREMGEPATQALLGEIALTLQLKPYRRRVLAVGTRHSS